MSDAEHTQILETIFSNWLNTNNVTTPQILDLTWVNIYDDINGYFPSYAIATPTANGWTFEYIGVPEYNNSLDASQLLEDMGYYTSISEGYKHV